ncbi:MAG: hypothetical protein BWY98_00592 [Tenericutes bacterium ADurb.BinA155]|nr:MAG: hypothetical protein BWY98_00592 [Tenericutes bacterium ADurb.BinA155]
MSPTKKISCLFSLLLPPLLLGGCTPSNSSSSSSSGDGDAWVIQTPYDGTKTISFQKGLRHISESMIFEACGYGDNDISLGLYASIGYRLHEVYQYDESQGTLSLYAMSKSQYEANYLSIKVGDASVPVLKDKTVDPQWIYRYLGQYALTDDRARYGFYTDSLFLHYYTPDFPTSSLQLYYATVEFYSFWSFLFVAEALSSQLKVSFAEQSDVASFTSWADLINSKDPNWLQSKTISGVYRDPSYTTLVSFESINSHNPYLLYLQLA